MQIPNESDFQDTGIPTPFVTLLYMLKNIAEKLDQTTSVITDPLFQCQLYAIFERIGNRAKEYRVTVGATDDYPESTFSAIRHTPEDLSIHYATYTKSLVVDYNLHIRFNQRILQAHVKWKEGKSKNRLLTINYVDEKESK